jgi:hypothetical protein
VGQGATGRRIAKADDLVVSPQYATGIPKTRVSPVNPLAIMAGANIMADFAIGAMGRNLTAAQRKQVRAEAYRFAGARGTLFSNLGRGSTVTG